MNAIDKMQLDATIKSMIGPVRQGNAVIVDGRRIPLLHCFEKEDSIHFILDGRFGIEVPKAIAYSFADFVANALAIGQGYAFLGSITKDRPFAPRSICLGTDEDGPSPAPLDEKPAP